MTVVRGALGTVTLVVWAQRSCLRRIRSPRTTSAGSATGWLPGRLSPTGRELARDLGVRRRNDGLAAVFTSDLYRAVETTSLAFGAAGVPILTDWRLRECDFGDLNGAPRAQVHDRRRRWLDTPYPEGESWRQAVRRASGVLRDLPSRWDGQRVLVIGHVATRWALDHYVGGVALKDLIED
ncbi:MAG: histidine phosphatase family protein, partial [Actinomycetota bacterium]|nr:histidine phosphatase family protein [Actinomycetota bacterium]